MQLNDILEENSVKAISDKTNISDENLEHLFASDFDALTKVKALGFISILEREYDADLSALREQAVASYGQSGEGHFFPIGQPVTDESRSKPKVMFLLILILLGFSSWYFFTQFDKKHLNSLIPFIDEQTIESFTGSSVKAKEENVAKNLSIENVIVNTSKQDETVTKNTVVSSMDENTTDDNKSTDNSKRSTL